MLTIFLDSYRNVTAIQIIIEVLVFVTGILSVWFAKKENIWVYPIGLIGTALTVYLLFQAGYIGDMLVNAYFSVMSIYGWYNWYKPTLTENKLEISRTTKNEKVVGVLLFSLTVIVVYLIYKLFNYELLLINYFDILSSGLFFAGMWYMAKKKIENWTLWIIGDLIVIPLYLHRGLGMLALQYIIFTLLAISAYIEWKKILDNKQQLL